VARGSAPRRSRRRPGCRRGNSHEGKEVDEGIWLVSFMHYDYLTTSGLAAEDPPNIPARSISDLNCR
jgi:hypothetical protein